jgi:tRNA(fMet)-specific endonuclease VapC
MAHFDEAVARHASSVYLALAARGALIGALDILIAGTALAHSAVLVTRNVRDLSRVPDLKVEDWYAC